MTITDNLPARRGLIGVVLESAPVIDRLPATRTPEPAPVEVPSAGVSAASVAGIFTGMVTLTSAAFAFIQYVA